MGRVRWALRRQEIPHLTPALSAPWGRRGKSAERALSARGRRGRGPVASATGRVRWALRRQEIPDLTPALSAPWGRRGRSLARGRSFRGRPLDFPSPRHSKIELPDIRECKFLYVLLRLDRLASHAVRPVA